MNALQLTSPAKINLTLAILGRRADGFHDIESWIVPISLYDELAFQEAGAFEFHIPNADSNLPADPTNLVWRAADALARAAGIEMRGRITLTKNIPIGAGLGGGSSDAAAALLGLNKLWRLHWPLDRLAPIAAALGSDVPFFLDPRPSIMRGRGERIAPLSDSWKGWIALVVPPFGLSTARVYQEHSARAQAPAPNETQPRAAVPHCSSESPWTHIGVSAAALAKKLFNDLEPAAFACESRLAAMHALLNEDSTSPVRMTGSGSALFSLFDARPEAQAWTADAQGRLGASAKIIVVSSL